MSAQTAAGLKKKMTPTVAASHSLASKRRTEVAQHLENLSSSLDSSASTFGHDFSHVKIQPPPFQPTTHSCPLSSSPRACPFGGACHTCPSQVQNKLATGQPDDIYEREADEVADRVMQMPEDQVLQRKCSKCDEDDDRVLQAKELPGQAPTTTQSLDAPPIVYEVLKSPSQSLDPVTRAFMEPRFAYDFSPVKVHTDAKAAESARAVKALAYTVGRDVVFGAGQYEPHTAGGCWLIGHELTHTIQQYDVIGSTQSPLAISVQRNFGENQASVVATRVAQAGAMEVEQITDASGIARLQRQTEEEANEEEVGAVTTPLSDGRNIRYRCGEILGCPLTVDCNDRPCAVVDCGKGTCPTCPPGFGNIIWRAWCSYRCVPSGSAFVFISTIGNFKVGPICLD